MMFITISMIIEALTDCALSDIKVEKRDSVCSIRMLISHQKMERGILYLSQAAPDVPVRCQTATGSSFYADMDLFRLLNRIMSVLDEYNRWDQKLLTAVERGSTLTELLNLSYPVISHPLIILDANEWEIAHSDSAVYEVLDTDWTDMILHHTSDTEKVAAFNQNYYKYFNLKNVYRIPGDIFGPGYACNLFSDQIFCGVMIMAEPEQLPAISRAELDAMQYLCEIISNMIRSNSYDLENHYPEKPFLEYLESKDSESLERLERSLEILSWEKTDPKWMIYAKPSNSGYLAPVPAHSRLVFNRMEGIVTVTYNTGLIFLCNLRLLGGRKQGEEILSKYFRQIFYYGGSSSEFTDFARIKEMLEQAEISLKSSTGAIGSICVFEDAVMPYIISKLRITGEQLLIHPCVEILKNYDKRNGNKLSETFFAYLLNERRIAQTAGVLDIPRSTLLNRLQRIDEILDIDVDQPEIRLHIILSYMLDREKNI